LKKYCGIHVEATHPSLYDILGVSQKSISDTALSRALKAAIESLKTVPADQRDAPWQTAAKAIQQARKTFSSPESKAAYDQKLAQLRSPVDAAKSKPSTPQSPSKPPPKNQPAVSIPTSGPVAAPTNLAPQSERAAQPSLAAQSRPNSSATTQNQPPALDSKSPASQTAAVSATPNLEATFDPAAFVAAGHIQHPVESAENRLDQMKQVLALSNQSGTVNQSAARLLSPSSPPPHTASAIRSTVADAPSGIQLRRIKQKRQQRAMLATAFGLLASGGIVGGVIYYLLTKPDSDPIANNPEVRIANSRPTTELDATQVNPLVPANPRGPSNSNLGPLPDVGARMGDDSQTGLQTDLEPNANASMGDSPISLSDAMSSTNSPNGSSQSETLADDESVRPTQPLTESEKADLGVALTAARTAILDGQFEQFEKIMNDQVAIPLDPILTAKIQRLDQFGQLLRIFDSALGSAIDSLSASETIAVQGSEFSFVESNADSIVVRIAGSNQEFSRNRMPLGLTLALADLKLDRLAGIDVGARGVFCLVAGRKNFSAKSKADEFLDRAIKSGQVREDIRETLVDTYP
jgi:curved DNA-binding protein CbpA